MTDRAQYTSQYNKEHYEQMTLRVPLGVKGRMQDIAKRTGMSIPRLCIDAVEKQYGIVLRENREPERRRFGVDQTNLWLSKKAKEVLYNSAAVTIWEYPDGTYDVFGVVEKLNCSAEEVNTILESLSSNP